MLFTSWWSLVTIPYGRFAISQNFCGGFGVESCYHSLGADLKLCPLKLSLNLQISSLICVHFFILQILSAVCLNSTYLSRLAFVDRSWHCLYVVFFHPFAHFVKSLIRFGSLGSFTSYGFLCSRLDFGFQLTLLLSTAVSFLVPTSRLPDLFF